MAGIDPISYYELEDPIFYYELEDPIFYYELELDFSQQDHVWLYFVSADEFSHTHNSLWKISPRFFKISPMLFDDQPLLFQDQPHLCAVLIIIQPTVVHEEHSPW